MQSETLNELNRQALRLACIALDLAELVGEPANLCMALANVARCHARRGALDEAAWYAERGLRIARGLPAVDASVDALCELAELAARQADRFDVGDEGRSANHHRDIARDRAFEAAHLALRSADPRWEITVLLRISDLFDSLGDHDDAIALQTRAVELMSGAASTPSLAA
jgi:tetratricopeptide (TPR) repeat protein